MIMNIKDVVLDIKTNSSSISEIRITHTPTGASVNAVGQSSMIRTNKLKDELLDQLESKVLSDYLLGRDVALIKDQAI